MNSTADLTSRTGSSVARGQACLAGLQHPDGSWEAEVVWSPVVTAQAAIVQACVGQCPTGARRDRMVQQFRVTLRPDGGWGLHPESHSYVFVTTVVYIAARLLGVPAGDAMLAGARAFLSRQPGGVLANPQWGRFWMALVGLYDWADLNACPAELFLLPRGSALSPLRFYCHTRYIYLAMAYLGGVRFHADLGPVLDDIRAELPGLAGARGARHAVAVAATDLHELPGPVLSIAYAATRVLGPLWRAMPGSELLRRRALRNALARIRYEQRATGFQGLSPVSGLLNTLALHHANAADPDAAASLAGAEYWCWNDATDGLRYAGARSMAWDTSFALQALADGSIGSVEEHGDAMRRGYDRLRTMQATTELPDRIAEDRDTILGGWCFTEGTQAWPVSDCTAEAVLALLACHDHPGLIDPDQRISPQHLAEAASFILSRQNADGGFGSYERRRGARFLETLNPSEMFGRCMTELTYVECTASAIRALRRILDTEAPIDRAAAEQAVRQGTAIVLSRQNLDGSWPGFWGINAVYGTLFALTALRDVGLATDHASIQAARAWLEARQKGDGGWGEHFSGCATGTYVDNPESLVISTAWATLALLCTSEKPGVAAMRGGAWLRLHQDETGDWPRDSVNGVFFGTAMLDYRLYNTYFPLMALTQLDRLTHA
ncbi:prenyltransferase/squalene oxidase repeat-containing protein [Lichenihabitans sp. Uapishka_5]|uniref:prenyltransferase/squalene oxidase repeat-containing protein n=1 Tax=Lichenihabitans sp. Uapishka_5 TaxID=3037302 RepID=UPI0029E7D5B4|nr:prenyltransferase/squalene oxidase repeat-containing protein [Lichenihabitans sp. Uapishka_5]MDX7949697.1 prenyltransferase/squalene oxidase repeat-containing protein [Lichenihabitans sp. Uapishka_5]